MASVTFSAALRPRAYLRVAGPDAADFLQRLVSNDVEALAPGQSCEALLLTPKARVIAPLVVLRRAPADFLLLTEPTLAEPLRANLTRMRLRARCEIESEAHRSLVVFGGKGGIPNREFGGAAVELLDPVLEPTLSDDELELRRIEAGTPRFGREIDERVLPAEAGLTATHVSFTKGCYPGQEPVARLHHRGHANRTLRVLEVDAPEPPEYDAELSHEGKAVGRVTSAARRRDGSIVALGYVRVAVPDDAELALPGGTARPLH
ncbi:MAG: folate-binding protein YgfZ [Gaiellaceae bacterium]